MSDSTILRIPVTQYRSLPPPAGFSKIGFFFARCQNIPPDLWNWREVNPREVSRGSAVWKAITGTLTEEPEHFFERNRGLTISADAVEYDDRKRQVVISLKDRRVHGLVDGGHTLDAILEVQKAPPDEDWPANVFIKIFTGVESDQIAEIAGGLNRSQQVDLRSLENLREHFKELQKVLAKEAYAEKIAYKMNEEKPIDVREVLYYLAVFDRDVYDDNKHPTKLFGRKEGIVRDFAAQAEKQPDAGDSFRVLITRAPEILRLRDLIEKKITEIKNIGYFKAGDKERIKSKKHRRNELHFLGQTTDGKIPLGWIMPMLGGFRANVEWRQPKNSFSWKVPNEELLDKCLSRLVSSIREIHSREGSRPEHVGRSASAWRVCYETVRTAILEYQLEQARAPVVQPVPRKRDGRSEANA